MHQNADLFAAKCIKMPIFPYKNTDFPLQKASKC